MMMGSENVCFRGHVGDIESSNQLLYSCPYLQKAGELKTKPTQHSVKELRSIGIQPDIIVCRSEKELSEELKNKIGLFCNLDGKSVIQNLDADCLYELPLMLHREGLDTLVCEKLGLHCSQIDNSRWEQMVNKMKNPAASVNIALVGKYVKFHDAYLSVAEALKHGGLDNDARVNISWVDAENVTEGNAAKLLKSADGILVPGGFGDRGIEGKIEVIRYARENNIPFLGICLGMQCAVIEYSRNVLGFKDAHSSEINPGTTHPVIDLMPDQKGIDEMGGTMRLGAYPCRVERGTFSWEAYGEEIIYERHRHRYEFNNEYRSELTKAGMVLSGTSPDGKLVEIIELKNHPWFVGVQFHPEFKSRPNRPHPLFRDFIKASINNKTGQVAAAK
jgi:CTP synthase